MQIFKANIDGRINIVDAERINEKNVWYDNNRFVRHTNNYSFFDDLDEAVLFSIKGLAIGIDKLESEVNILQTRNERLLHLKTLGIANK